MSSASPLEQVREEHDSKGRLAGKILDHLDAPEHEDPEEFDNRIHTMSNKKLLRLWDSIQRVEDEFGSKSDLVEAIVAEKFPKGNSDYQDKLAGFTYPRLLGLAREVGLIDAQ